MMRSAWPIELAAVVQFSCSSRRFLHGRAAPRLPSQLLVCVVLMALA